MKTCKNIPMLFFTILVFTSAAFSQTGTGYFNGTVFNTFTDATTITSGSLAGNNFTVSYINGGAGGGSYSVAKQQSYTPGNMPANSGYPSTPPGMLEVRGSTTTPSSPFPAMTWAFTSDLQQLSTVFIQDVDFTGGSPGGNEGVMVEFLDASGTAISTSNIIVKTSSTSGLPVITKNTTDITVVGNGVNNPEPLIGLTITSTNVRSVRVTEIQGASDGGGTYEVYFGIVATDHGDAPSGYGDAQHFISTDLGLGSVIPDAESAANFSVNADGDNTSVDATTINDEDGVSGFSVLTGAATSYSVNVNVSNTTGADATLYGWIDFNRNGVFDAGERSASVTVANGAGSATVNWTGLSGLVLGQTYARFRIAANSTEAQSPTGAAFTGEVEDYTLDISTTLPLTFLNFSTKRNGDDILINWKTTNETNVSHFEVEYNTGGTSFINGGTIAANNNTENNYRFTLSNFTQSVYYIRIKWVDMDGTIKYSSVATVKKADGYFKSLKVTPNPASDNIIVRLVCDISTASNITITNTAGALIYQNKVELVKGENQLYVSALSTAANGIYLVRAAIGNDLLTTKLVLAR